VICFMTEAGTGGPYRLPWQRLRSCKLLSILAAGITHVYSKLPPLLNSRQQAGASSLAIKAALLLPSPALSGAKISNLSSQNISFSKSSPLFH
jgi:hypothetical protein